MDPATLAASALAMQQQMLATHVQMAVMKRAMATEAQGVMKLLEGAVQAAANPPHLGNRVDTTA